VFAPALLASGPRGVVPAAGQVAGRTVYIPCAFRDRLAPKQGASGGPCGRGGGRRLHSQGGQMAQGTVRWFNGDRGCGFIVVDGGLGCSCISA